MAVVVTARSRERDNAMAVAWHSSISVKPPLYGVALSPKRFTYQLILESKEFGINFLPFEEAQLVAAVGGSKGAEVDKYQAFGITKDEPLKTAVPILKLAYAAYECQLFDHRTYGDHEWLVGRIVAVHFVKEAFTTEGAPDWNRISPALYLGAELYSSVAKGSLRHLDRQLYGGKRGDL